MAKPKKQKLSQFVPEGDVKAFWDNQAKVHGGSDIATAPDHHYRKMEIDCAIRAMEALEPLSILDVGCGNGYATKLIANHFPEANVTGVDFSEEMINEANINHNCSNVDYYTGDVLSLSRTPELIGKKYDVVLSTRCLINLANWDEQKIGILEMRKMLNPNGHIVLIENVQEGLDNLNSLRKGVGLPPIKVRWHNFYMPQTEITKFFGEVKGHLLDVEYVENIGNFYYLASRVLYAKICADKGVEPDYDNPINAIASQLPTMGAYYACSPNFMFVLRNVGGQWQDRKLSS